MAVENDPPPGAFAMNTRHQIDDALADVKQRDRDAGNRIAQDIGRDFRHHGGIARRVGGGGRDQTLRRVDNRRAIDGGELRADVSVRQGGVPRCGWPARAASR